MWALPGGEDQREQGLLSSRWRCALLSPQQGHLGRQPYRAPVGVGALPVLHSVGISSPWKEAHLLYNDAGLQE